MNDALPVTVSDASPGTAASQAAAATDLSWLERGLIAAAVAAAAIWLWLSWCIFPLRSWNDIRLAPTFALKLGLPLYPGADGAASTWMYGPLPVWLNWPATWMPGPGEALFVAGGINAGIQVAAILAVCLAWPTPRSGPVSLGGRLLAAAVTIAIWPWANWQFLQADNFAVACGLLANLVLARSGGEAAAWGAAALVTAGLMCKQTSLGVPLGQVAWLAATVGTLPALKHVGRLALTGSGWLAVLLATTDLRRAWFTAILTPAGLPWANDILERFMDLAPHFAIHLAVPVATWLWLMRRQATADLLLPTLVWAAAWLPGVASAFKIGGTLNNLQGFPLWLPPAAVVMTATFSRMPRGRAIRIALAIAAIAALAGRIATRPVRIWRPLIVAYDDARDLSRQFPGQIWFPWNPLVTVFSEGRLYQVEDGLYVRSLVSRPVPKSVSREHLPPRFAAMAVSNQGSTWGIAEKLLPAPLEAIDLGNWTLSRVPGGPAIVTEEVAP